MKVGDRVKVQLDEPCEPHDVGFNGKSGTVVRVEVDGTTAVDLDGTVLWFHLNELALDDPMSRLVNLIKVLKVTTAEIEEIVDSLGLRD